MGLTETTEMRAAICRLYPHANETALTCVVRLGFAFKLKWIKAHVKAAGMRLEQETDGTLNR